MPPRKRPPPGKRRRKKKDARKAQIRNALIGAGLVMATFVTVGVVALHELQLEEAERQRALLAAVQPNAPKSRPTPKTTLGASDDPLPPGRIRKLSELELGLPQSKVQDKLGAPDVALSDHRFRYSALGLEVQYRPVGGKLVLDSIAFSGSEVPAEAMGALDLPGLQVGAPPGILETLLPRGRILFNRTSNTYTLYLPSRHLAVDFTPEAIQAVRMEQGLKDHFDAARSGPHDFEVSFDQAFSAQSMFGQRLTDAQFDMTIQKVPGDAPVHTIALRLKVDDFNADDLREAIKRRVNMQIAAGDVAAAVTVLAKNGSKIVDCDWYSPRYAELTGNQPRRFGAIDTIDNISYRWY